MDPKTSEPPRASADLSRTAPRRISRRGTLIGSVIAILVVAGIGWLAWTLTHSDSPTVAGASRPAGAQGQGAGGAGAGGAGAGGARSGAGGGRAGARGPATTVGIAAAERMDIPIVLDALGTVVPQATVRVRPQVGGVLQQVL